MSLLTVDVGGASETVLPFAKAGHAEPRQVGKRRYAFAGNERSMIRSEPMVIPLVGDNMPASTVKTLRTLFANGAQVYCDGDVFNNGGLPVLCSGEITDEMEQGGTYWIPTLTLKEVSARTAGLFAGSVATGGLGGALVTINGPRRGSVGVAGAGTASIALVANRASSVSAAGTSSASITLSAIHVVQTAAGVGTATVTLKAIRLITATAGGRGTTTVTGTKIP